MLGYEYGASQYPQFHYRGLDKYQVLTRPYLGSFEGCPGEKSIKERWLLDFAGQTETFFLECNGRMIPNKYWGVFKECLTTAT